MREGPGDREAKLHWRAFKVTTGMEPRPESTEFPGVLGQLGTHVHEGAQIGDGEVARWWAGRARHTAGVLRNLTRGPATTDVASG